MTPYKFKPVKEKILAAIVRYVVVKPISLTQAAAEEAKKPKPTAEEQEELDKAQAETHEVEEVGSRDLTKTQSKQKKVEVAPVKPRGPSRALAVSYSNRGTFFLSLGDFDAGYLYECSFDLDEPIVCPCAFVLMSLLSGPSHAWGIRCRSRVCACYG